MEKIPLPGTLGRVCPAPCEKACRRVDVDTPVAIRELKRFAADQVDFTDLPLPEIEDRPEKIAVIGSGPAGLTVAYYLRLKGYRITLFEALDQLGGMLRVGIPDYRLPAKLLDNEIQHLLRHGIDVETNVRFGRDLSLSDLESKGFSAVFLGIGAHGSLQMQIQGEDQAAEVIDAVGFLREINLGSRKAPGRRVIVIGGGNVAIDAARVAKRLGAEHVTVVYRRSEREMPAYKEEITGAREEGIELSFLTAPVGIQSKDGHVTGCTCIQTELGPPDASGRRRPVPVKGSEYVVPCDAVIPAIGQKIDVSWATKEPGLELTTRNTIKVNPATMQTSLPHVFGAGDAVTGPATVIEAVAAGHKAVAAIHRYLKEEDRRQILEQADVDSIPGNNWKPVPEDVETTPRVVSTQLDPQQRVKSFHEVDHNFSEEAARAEACTMPGLRRAAVNANCAWMLVRQRPSTMT